MNGLLKYKHKLLKCCSKIVYNISVLNALFFNVKIEVINFDKRGDQSMKTLLIKGIIIMF